MRLARRGHAGPGASHRWCRPSLRRPVNNGLGLRIPEPHADPGFQRRMGTANLVEVGGRFPAARLRAMGPLAPMLLSSASPLVLGSASPRRREILEGLGLPVVVLPGAAVEQAWQGEDPEDYVAQAVQAKLDAVAARLGGWSFAAVLVADTIVVIGTEVLGKPASVADAERLLGLLVGRTHSVLTRYAIAGSDDARRPLVARTVRTEVTLRAATTDELARYARTGEGLDKAGAYAAQGIGCFLVERITGSYTNVVGLPACEVVLDLRDARLLGSFP